MPDNKYQKIEDFLLDDSFVEWVLHTHQTSDIFWNSYIDQHPERAEDFYQARQIILSIKVKPVTGLTDSQVDQIIANVRSKYAEEMPLSSTPVRFFNMPAFMRYAAIFAVIVSVAWFGYHALLPNTEVATQAVAQQNYQEVINRSKVASLVKLPDLSLVVLQPNARIKFPTAFKGDKREVYLSGEAFFEVSKNAHKPFFVYAHELKVRVVGTSFTIKEYAGEKKYKVLVSTGRVEVSARSQASVTKAKQPVVLIANQECTLYSKGLQFQKTALKEPLLLSQESTKKHFNFVAASFSEVVTAIKEAYGVTIVYNEKAMGNCQLTASLIDQTLDERLKLICQAVEATYKYENGQVVIDGKGCNITNTTPN